MKKAPRRYAVAGTVNPRHGYHWSRIKGFSDWFIRIASQRTNHELAGEILAVWKQTTSRAAIDSLRRQFDAHMTPETRRRAYEKRNNTATVGEQDAEAKTLMESRAAHRRTLSKLEEARVTKKELVDAVYAAAKDAASSLAIAPVRKPTPPKSARDREGETALIVVSDQQLGKRTPTYSSEICEERMARYMDKVELLTQIQRSYHPVRKARVYLLGDIIEGEMIFPGQAHRIDSSLYRQVVVDGPRIISDVIRRALGLFDEVHVVGVIGNHGAIGGPSRREYHPESNGDLMLYRVVQTIFEQSKQDRLTFDIPYLRGERSWYSVDVVGDHKFFLFHGDQMRGGGFGGLPYYGFGRAINNWAAGVIPEGFKYALCGHWHQMASIPINDRMLWINGSTESNNEWLREELKAQCPPGQWLLFAHPKNGVTAEYRCWLS